MCNYQLYLCQLRHLTSEEELKTGVEGGGGKLTLTVQLKIKFVYLLRRQLGSWGTF